MPEPIRHRGGEAAMRCTPPNFDNMDHRTHDHVSLLFAATEIYSLDLRVGEIT
jgi:hypothetical protein